MAKTDEVVPYLLLLTSYFLLSKKAPPPKKTLLKLYHIPQRMSNFLRKNPLHQTSPFCENHTKSHRPTGIFLPNDDENNLL